LTFINIKVAIQPKDVDLNIEIIQEVPKSQILYYTGTGLVSALACPMQLSFGLLM
jgi:hypothetical protein